MAGKMRDEMPGLATLLNHTPEWLRLPGARFATTHWSEVLAAGNGSEGASRAVEQLCRTYWYPMYAYLRRHGQTPHDAQDLTQELFARLLLGNQLAGITQGRGRFRSFLLVALNHLLINHKESAAAAKRGGGQTLLALDVILAENRYDLEPADELSPDKIFERRWALTLLEHVLSRLRAECEQSQRSQQFEELKVFLSGEKSSLTYVEVGQRLGLSEGGVKSAMSRLRKRYRELMREEVAQTVANPIEVEDEIRHLSRILSGSG